MPRSPDCRRSPTPNEGGERKPATPPPAAELPAQVADFVLAEPGVFERLAYGDMTYDDKKAILAHQELANERVQSFDKNYGANDDGDKSPGGA